MVATHSPCPYCGCFLHEEVRSQVGPHYGFVRCSACARVLRWLPWPGREKRRRPAAHRDLVEKYGRGYCELCLRTAELLPEGIVLEAHHVQQYADGGGHERANVWILCATCHAVVHTVRMSVKSG